MVLMGTAEGLPVSLAAGRVLHAALRRDGHGSGNRRPRARRSAGGNCRGRGRFARLTVGKCRVVELSGLQRPGDLVSTEDDAGRHCFRADEVE